MDIQEIDKTLETMPVDRTRLLSEDVKDDTTPEGACPDSVCMVVCMYGLIEPYMNMFLVRLFGVWSC
ncbi:hypothetical protein EON63_19910 [archaeon]|nr:MAG: hypothetical protein EON63_19910 [archaeon]